MRLTNAWLTGTHYEAMDVDTPPRASPAAIPPFPPSTTTTSNPFHFAPLPPLRSAEVHEPQLSFDPEAFSPTEAFGLDRKAGVVSGEGEPLGEGREEEDKENDMSLTLASGFMGEEGGEARRRRAGAGRRARSPERRKAREDKDDEDSALGGMMGNTAGTGRRVGSSSDFSFQVHHHHGASATDGGAFASAPERWLDSKTPYTLLG